MAATLPPVHLGGVSIDPVDLAVLSHRFDGIVRSMASTLLRSGRSVVLNTGRDFSCCIITKDAEVLATAESIATHVLNGPDLMAKVMKDFHPALAPGDAFLHNSPYHGNSHPADLSVLVPVFDDDRRHRFTVLSKAHQADIGCAEPTTYSARARDVYEEGAMLFPCVKVQHNYSDIEDIIRLCRLRIRVPDQWWGDYLALLGAARVGERNIRLLANEVGWEKLDAFVQTWFDYSEQLMAEAIGALPEGVTTVTSCHDPFDRVPEGIPVKASITVCGGRVEIDLRDNLDCQPCGLNLSEATARSAALLGVFNAIGADVPPNAGSFRRVTVHLRENCVVGIPRHPASCSVATDHLPDRVANAIQRGLAEIAPGYGLAEVGLSFPASVSVLSGADPRREGERFIDQIILGWTGGPGGPFADGWLTMGGVGDAGVLMRDSVELDELRFPIRVESQRVVPDTEGAGRRRGAPSAEVAIQVVGTRVDFMYLSDGTVNPALGVLGGTAGGCAAQAIVRSDGTTEVADACAHLTLCSGDTLVSRCCGGGGYGPPGEREPERVLKDVEEGYITLARAREVYRVGITESLEVDAAATYALRDGVNRSAALI